jgi:GH15 family glucan-1,4-alpha-glucosidase
VLDAGWLLARAGHRLYGETWRALSGFADLVAHRWREPDAGIWEVRGEPRHYVHSKLMGWLALDRALRIAATHPTARSRRQRWEAERTALGADIVARGFEPPFLHRYPPGFDGLAGGEGVFLPCSFWLLQPLARLGRVEAARAEFARLLACAGELGLFAEELDPATGAYLGNYPQALTHAALVQAAFALRDAEPATRP